ncbi:MAG: RluA family pseudouridine synthase [Treponema sp.]|jgi:23S rRNA pseudouridine1911/1915/1917 synthase|nr:RluA family pseudouridine synthase [Treponema sp.]
MPSFNITVNDIDPAGLRLDRYIAENLCLLSRSQIKARELEARVNGKAVKISRIIKNGDKIELSWNEERPVSLIPENIPLDIIFENNRAVVINKPQGMVVHPGAGNWQGTLANALYHRRLELRITENGTQAHGLGHGPRPGLRPGIVHRLDKDTSGVIIAAWDDEALAFLAEQFKARKARKTYIAIVSGIPKEKKGRIETFIARDTKDRKRFTVSVPSLGPGNSLAQSKAQVKAPGKAALTLYSVIKTWQSHSLLLLRPKTGRTHQIRVHLRHLGHPVAGDTIYGFTDPVFQNAGLMLHSRSLAITLPGETEQRVFKAPLPERFTKMIKLLTRGKI